MSVRSNVALVAGRLTRWGLTTLLHRHASQLPGRVALAIDRDFIAHRRARLRLGSIAVCGTNGKTTTTNMIAAALEEQGYRVLCNHDGANMPAGIASALLGPTKADWAVIEMDELSTIHALPQLRPTQLLLLNLFRDQLDRAGEIDHVQDTLVEALSRSPETSLVVCADDPIAMGVATRAHAAGTPVLTFGIDHDLGLPVDRVPEGRFCQVCGTELTYDWHSYAQLGKFSCPSCDFKRPPLDFAAQGTQVSLDHVSLAFETKGASPQTVEVGLGGAYMAYNLLAATSSAHLAGVRHDSLQQALDGYHPHNGRLQHFRVDNREIILNLAKNPAGFNQNIYLLLKDTRPKAVLVVVNDNPNDGRDVSWIWDVDFERLVHSSHELRLLSGGHRAEDVQVRLKYAGAKAQIVTSIAAALHAVQDMPHEQPLYVLVNYSALEPAREELDRLEASHG